MTYVVSCLRDRKNDHAPAARAAAAIAGCTRRKMNAIAVSMRARTERDASAAKSVRRVLGLILCHAGMLKSVAGAKRSCCLDMLAG